MLIPIDSVACPVRPVSQSEKSSIATHDGCRRRCCRRRRVGQLAPAARRCAPAAAADRPTEMSRSSMPVSSRSRAAVDSLTGRSSTTAKRGAAPSANTAARMASCVCGPRVARGRGHVVGDQSGKPGAGHPGRESGAAARGATRARRWSAATGRSGEATAAPRPAGHDRPTGTMASDAPGSAWPAPPACGRERRRRRRRR